jgi:N-acetylmuramoyl-L-alanine amidase
MLANDLRRKLLEQGAGEDQIVFLSLHADSLHESATGAMAYHASARLRAPACGVPDDPLYRRCREATEANAFEMSRREMLRSEGLSRQLAETLIASLREGGVGVHGFSPVRGSIQRGGHMVPAVLRYNRVPASVLLEVCNLNNASDRRHLRDPVFRQQVAEAVVDGLVDHYDGREVARAPRAPSSASRTPGRPPRG